MRWSNQGMWGLGNYFAVNSQYSNAYASKLGAGGQRQMFLATVIIGNEAVLQSDRSLKMPPLLPGSSTDRYDSVKGNYGDSDIFIVYSNKKAYPSYLITYKP